MESFLLAIFTMSPWPGTTSTGHTVHGQVGRWVTVGNFSHFFFLFPFHL